LSKIIGPVTSDKWEREVRRQLENQLPSDWIVVCNVSWALRNESGYVRDGQCDFVVLAPNLGMAILEVKGSRSVSVGSDGIWYRTEFNRRTGSEGPAIAIKEAPPEQANRNMHTLAELLCKEYNLNHFPGAFSFLVAYPNGEVKGITALYDKTTIVTKSRMGQLQKCLIDSLKLRGALESGKKFTYEIALKFSQTLSNSKFIVQGVDTPLDVLEDLKEIDELTRQQFAALRGAFELQSVAILGPAGSGKTMLALWKLEALLEEGKKAIYVCFNKYLAEWLRNKNLNLAPMIVSVDKFFTQIGGSIPNVIRGNQYYLEILPQQVFEVAVDLKSSEKFDAIIVDEGQDFGESRVIALLELLKRDGQWIFFADWQQDIFKSGKAEVLGAEVIFRLYHNCRNTELINRAINQYCSQSVKPMLGVPIGVTPLIENCANVENLAARTWAIVNQLNPAGVTVILSPFRLENSCMADTRKGYGLEVTEDIENLGKAGYVFFSTIKAFKGLEAENVILIHADIPGRIAALEEEDLYVACSRATSRLAILTNSDEALSWYSR
jgi:hypothetical protein